MVTSTVRGKGTDFGNYHGNVKVKLTNLDGHVTLIKEGMSFSNADSRLQRFFLLMDL